MIYPLERGQHDLQTCGLSSRTRCIRIVFSNARTAYGKNLRKTRFSVDISIANLACGFSSGKVLCSIRYLSPPLRRIPDEEIDANGGAPLCEDLTDLKS